MNQITENPNPGNPQLQIVETAKLTQLQRTETLETEDRAIHCSGSQDF